MTEPNDPLQQLWQHQETPMTTLDLDAIRLRSEAFAKRLRKRNLREYLAAAFVVVVFGAMALFGNLPPLARFGSVLVIAATVLVTGRIRRLHPRDPPVEATTSAHLTSLRRELERQRDSLASVARWYLAPFVPGVLLMQLGTLVGRSGVAVVAAVNVAVTFGVLAFIVRVNRRAARKLDEELRSLPL